MGRLHIDVVLEFTVFLHATRDLALPLENEYHTHIFSTSILLFSFARR